MSALSHQREVGGPINYIIQFLLDNSSVIRIFKIYLHNYSYNQKIKPTSIVQK